jgi:bacteriocin-like protein
MKNFKNNQLSTKDLQKVKGGETEWEKRRREMCESSGGYWSGYRCVWALQ